MSITIPDYSQAKNSNQQLALLKQNIKYTLFIANPKNKKQKKQDLPVKLDCSTITVLSDDIVKLKYDVKRGNNNWGNMLLEYKLNVAWLEDQFVKNKLTKSTNSDGQTVYGML